MDIFAAISVAWTAEALMLAANTSPKSGISIRRSHERFMAYSMGIYWRTASRIPSRRCDLTPRIAAAVWRSGRKPAFSWQPLCVLHAFDDLHDVEINILHPSQTEAGLLDVADGIKAVGSRHQHGPQSVHDASQDWAVLLLDEAPQRMHPLAITEYRWPELQSNRGRITLPTYTGGGDENAVVSIDPSCSIKDFQWELLLHDCSAGLTGLGAPLLLHEGNCSGVVGIHSGRILVEVEGGQMLKLMGSSAVGAWSFAGPVRALAHQLEASERRASEGRRPLDACSVKTAGAQTGPAAAAKAVASRSFGKEPPW